MDSNITGYCKHLLNVNLTHNRIFTTRIPDRDLLDFIGGRGLGIKLLWDYLKGPGVDPLSPDNPLIFLTGPFSGLPIASASRTCVVTKSPLTSPTRPGHSHGATVSYSNFGGFFGPEIKFAGYDGIVITGRSPHPVYLLIVDNTVQVKCASAYWGMGTDAFDRRFAKDLAAQWDGTGPAPRFETCYIGPAGENLVPHAGIIHTASRASGRGVGCVMGAKNLKAIALKGTGFPDAGNDPELWSLMADSRSYFKGLSKGRVLSYLFKNRGTAFLLESKSKKGGMAVKNFREGTFPQVDRINAKEAGKRLWVRDYACYCCPLACKKSGMVKTGPYRGQLVHDGPEYETGTMLGANLMIADLEGIMKLVYDGDNLGLDIISAGNIIGFLMEAYERGHIDRDFLDGIDLIWGSVEGAAAILDKMVRRQGVGELAARGVKALSEEIGGDSNDFAMHVKGMEIAAHNVQADPLKGLCYATCNRGGCHQNGDSIREQDLRAVIDSLGICRFAALTPLGLSVDRLARLVSAVTGIRRTGDDLLKAGERIFNLEKVFNLREGFTREDDALPERFFTDAFTLGPKKGAVLRKKDFNQRLSQYYRERGWDPDSTVPSVKKLAELGLSFTL